MSNPCSPTLQTTDPAGFVTAYTYDQLDRETSVTKNRVSGTCVTAPCNVVTQYQYDRVGNRLATIDPRGNARRWTYDAADEALTATDALTRTTTWEYDLGGRVSTQHDPRGTSNDLTFTYDGLDRLTQTAASNLAGGSVQAGYDALGERLALVDGTGTTSFQYDPLGRISQVQAPTTGTVGYGYDANGQRTSLTYPDSTALTYGYWPDGQLQTVQQGATTLASYAYDSAGRLQSVARSNGATSTYGYDGADRLTNLSTSTGSTLDSSYIYQPNRLGQTTVVTETMAAAPPGGRVLAAPAGHSRVPASSWSAGAGDSPAVPALAIHAAGHTRQLTLRPAASAGTTLYLRLGIGSTNSPLPSGYLGGWNQTGNTSNIKKTLSSTAGASQLSSGARLSTSGGTTPLGQFLSAPLAAQTLAGGNWTVGFAGYKQGPASPSSEVFIGLVNGTTGALKATLVPLTVVGTHTLADGAEQTAYSVTINQAHGVSAATGDYLVVEIGALGAGLLVSATDFADGTTAIASDGVAISSARSFVTSPGGISFQPPTATPTNTPTNTATPTSTPTATFTATPTPTSSTRTIQYTYDGLQRLTSAVESPGASFAYTYDLAGNRTSVAVNGSTQATYQYDAANQVQGWTYDAAGNLTGDGTTTHTFDALNRLTGTAATGQARAFAYNGDGTLVSATANGTATTYAQDLAGGLSQVLAKDTQRVPGGVMVDYLYGSERLAALTGGVRSWYGWDGQGSARQGLSDAGAVTANQNYDPFGQPESGSSPSTFGYRGELQDSATNAVYLRARWYQPRTGQLLGVVDPALDQTGQPYAYAADDPVNGSDPMGRCTVTASDGTVTHFGGLGGGDQPCDSQVVDNLIKVGFLTSPALVSGAKVGVDATLLQIANNLDSTGGVLTLEKGGTLSAVYDPLTEHMVTGPQAEAAVNELDALNHAGAAPGAGEVTTLDESGQLVKGAVAAAGQCEGLLTGGARFLAWLLRLAAPFLEVGLVDVGGVLLLVTVAGDRPLPTRPRVTPATNPPRPATRISNNSEDPCRAPRVACFSKGARPEFYAGRVGYHIESAQLRGYPSMLSYAGGTEKVERRNAACTPERKALIGLPADGYTCDEYPFATTYEGGADSSVWAVLKADNDAQGIILNRFYRDNFGFIGNPVNTFLVLVVP